MRHRNPLPSLTTPAFRLARTLHEHDDRIHPWEALSAEWQDRYIGMAERAIAWCKAEAEAQAET